MPLVKKARRGEIDLTSVRGSLAKLPQLVIAIDKTDVLPRALDLATQLTHAFYDCVYLALAEASGEQLVTADKAFLAKLKGRAEGHYVTGLGLARG